MLIVKIVIDLLLVQVSDHLASHCPDTFHWDLKMVTLSECYKGRKTDKIPVDIIHRV